MIDLRTARHGIPVDMLRKNQHVGRATTTRNKAMPNESVNIDTRWFKTMLADRQLTQRQVAEHLELDASAVSLMLRGKRKLNLDEAAEFARLLGVPVADVLSHAGVDLPDDSMAGETVPVIGWWDADGRLNTEKGLRGPKRAVAPTGCVAGTVAARWQVGDAGGMTMFEGWSLFWLPVDYVQPEAIGRLAVVTTQRDRQPRVRLIRPGYGPGQYNLVRPGDGKTESGRLTSASMVTWCKQ